MISIGLHVIVYTTLDILYFSNGENAKTRQENTILSINFSPKSEKSQENKIPDINTSVSTSNEPNNIASQQKNRPLVTEQKSTSIIPLKDDVKESTENNLSEEREAQPTVAATKRSSKPGIKQQKPELNSNHKSQNNQQKERTEQQDPTAILIQDVEYLYWKKPDYPRISKRFKQQGIAYLKVTIDESGQPVQIQLHQSSGHDPLDNAALKAVKKWKFKPYTVGDTPTRAIAIIPIEFTLR